MVQGSRAREVIESFPPTSENYEKAIEALKNRFGKEELLFISLESIGLTSEKYEAILCPFVESCIPEELMRVWLQNPTQLSAENELTGSYGNKLKNLLCFLKHEVEGEERLQLAKNGMKFEFNNGNLKSKKNQNLDERVPTASNLSSGDMLKRQLHCVFCDVSHEGKDCFLAQNWSLDKKKKAISNKKACYVCFKGSHRVRECKSKIKCMICSKRHHIIMCFELLVNKGEISTNETIDSSNALIAEECSEAVLLQTIFVNIGVNGKQKCVRALIDSGSQNSHTLKQTAEELGLVPVSKRSLAHSLFGGIKTQVKDHGLYEIKLKSPNGKYSLDIQFWDQLFICRKIPRLKRGLWNKELRERKIWLESRLRRRFT
ncbi:integrase_H2C2 domain-containing protein [Trichonephila clavipes]|nr:integrase_H2C2 domain-containing protein [Trichonephila clavipes]